MSQSPRSSSSPRHTYKQLQMQQFRSLAETARLGSLAEAAKALGVAQPTVWEQVHALERYFGAKLVEPRRRGCRLTELHACLDAISPPQVFARLDQQCAPGLTCATLRGMMLWGEGAWFLGPFSPGAAAQ